VPGAPTANNAWFSGQLEFGGKLAFFFMPNLGEPSAQLWITDGTTSTQRLAAFSLPAVAYYPPVGDPSILFGGKLYFSIGDNLWRSDGTPAGTASVVALPPLSVTPGPPPSPSSLKFFATLGGTLFVVMREAEVWRVDGDAAQRVAIDPGVWKISAFEATPSRIYYAGSRLDPDFTAPTLRALTCEDH
jgi:ELWxxDGT repeat protein